MERTGEESLDLAGGRNSVRVLPREKNSSFKIYDDAIMALCACVLVVVRVRVCLRTFVQFFLSLDAGKLFLLEKACPCQGLKCLETSNVEKKHLGLSIYILNSPQLSS